MSAIKAATFNEDGKMVASGVLNALAERTELDYFRVKLKAGASLGARTEKPRCVVYIGF